METVERNEGSSSELGVNFHAERESGAPEPRKDGGWGMLSIARTQNIPPLTHNIKI